MTPREAIEWLQAILDDTLDAEDETDAGRIEAVELAITALEAVERAITAHEKEDST